MTPEELDAYVFNFQRRVLQDAVNNAMSAYWLRRAAAWEWAKPKFDEFHGQATREQLGARWRHADRMARECRQKAVDAPVQNHWPYEVAMAVNEARNPTVEDGGDQWAAPTRRVS